MCSSCSMCSKCSSCSKCSMCSSCSKCSMCSSCSMCSKCRIIESWVTCLDRSTLFNSVRYFAWRRALPTGITSWILRKNRFSLNIFLNILPNVRFYERCTIFYLLFFKYASQLRHYSIFIALFTLLHFFNKPCLYF